ncbi:methyltransferase domain-containing protein [Flavobacterium muglaense]|uniref:Methyltransferase domain-containing protein n=1 Tax=Flavobacterium muglaense TaxID=2764716 RepID=A0A923SEI5_9FLAO|nr:methyltransferase domain-containing protein [Flavobacterium muglaense]MBC5837068.1 methyltransferase domain-containing protein [Flavobacterium muglaense]MBC5843597.1 methyltransferase domain-containing protein [Flavobacterium muglaense]
MINYKNLDRGQWAETKLKQVVTQMPNKTVSDIGAGFGWFQPIAQEFQLDWQPFDYIRKIDASVIWDLNNPAAITANKPGFVIFLEVLEHLSNPEVGIRNIANHIETGGFIAITTPNPLSAASKFSLLFKNALYAFQEKHLVEHHVYVPLPHIVKFHLENNGFEIIEMATIGKLIAPKFRIRFNYLKDVARYLILQLFVLQRAESRGHTQAYFAIKK